MDAVRQEVDTLLNSDQMEEGGLQVYTTIDPQLQSVAQVGGGCAIAEGRAAPRLQAPDARAIPGAIAGCRLRDALSARGAGDDR